MNALNLTVPDELVDEIAGRVLDLIGARAQTPYMSVDEAADYMRCKPQRVYDLLSARRLTRLKDGSRVLVKREEIDAYLAARAA
jgi:excisionase family DNA binding protein